MRYDAPPGRDAPLTPDLSTEEIVEAGIALADSRGGRYAAAYPARNNIRFSVAVRVIAEPHLRRKR